MSVDLHHAKEYGRLGYGGLGYARIEYSRIEYGRLGYGRLGYGRLGYGRLGYGSPGYGSGPFTRHIIYAQKDSEFCCAIFLLLASWEQITVHNSNTPYPTVSIRGHTASEIEDGPHAQSRLPQFIIIFFL